MCFKNSITKPSPPDEIIESGWGDISMYEWCCAVAAEAHGVVVEEDGLVAVIKVEG